jgi:hypothetical protein
MYNSKIVQRIRSDSIYNGDGFTLMLVNDFGVPMQLRTMDIRAVYALLDEIPWRRMFLHSRAATQGSRTLENTHGWVTKDGTYYMHNGILQNAHSKSFAVDSQWIGHQLERRDINGAIKALQSEPYANVFFIHPASSWYCVYRSEVGTLFTDGRGNYSSSRVGKINKLVPDYSWETHDLPKPPHSYKRIAGTTIALDDDDDPAYSGVTEADWPKLSEINGLTESEFSEFEKTGSLKSAIQ